MAENQTKNREIGTGEPLIRVKELCKSFDGVDVLKNITTTIKKGEVVFVVGPSGSGKSTFLRCMNLLEEPTGGHIFFEGTDITDKNTDINLLRRKMGMVFQQFNLFPHMSIMKNMTIAPVKLLGVKEEDAVKEAEKLLARVGLLDKKDAYPGQLSGGQQQRVALARILAYEPEALLLDEPFSAMDTYLREGLRLELSKVLADYDGVSVMVTHDRDEAFQLCKNIMLLDKGHVLIAGNSRKIFQDPVTCKAARLTGCKNISKIERIGEYRVRALDWDNLEFVTDRTVGDDITAIGIRAHDFEPLAGEEAKAKKEAGEENLIPVVDPSISEMPFEWYITLSNGLWWKKEKTIHTHDAAGVVPEYLRADPSAILLLKGEL